MDRASRTDKQLGDPAELTREIRELRQMVLRFGLGMIGFMVLGFLGLDAVILILGI